MIKVVGSQSMYFPWVGMLEQIRLADVFVHGDEVQFTRGGFYNRVQVKTEQGVRWMTVPLRDHHRGQRIDEVMLDDRIDWRSQHRDMLRRAYRNAPFHNDMLALVDGVFALPAQTLSDVSRASMLALAEYFSLCGACRFLDAAALGIGGKSSQHVHDIVRSVGGTHYITGHGARNYLDHTLFERSGITVEYMDYRSISYPQLHGAFTPFVTGLDLVANCGRSGANVIVSGSFDWRDFLNQAASAVSRRTSPQHPGTPRHE